MCARAGRCSRHVPSYLVARTAFVMNLPGKCLATILSTSTSSSTNMSKAFGGQLTCYTSVERMNGLHCHPPRRISPEWRLMHPSNASFFVRQRRGRCFSQLGDSSFAEVGSALCPASS